MKNDAMSRAFARLSTPIVFDACLKTDLRPRTAPPGIRAPIPQVKLAGRVLPAEPTRPPWRG